MPNFDLVFDHGYRCALHGCNLGSDYHNCIDSRVSYLLLGETNGQITHESPCGVSKVHLNNAVDKDYDQGCRGQGPCSLSNHVNDPYLAAIHGL